MVTLAFGREFDPTFPTKNSPMRENIPRDWWNGSARSRGRTAARKDAGPSAEQIFRG